VTPRELARARVQGLYGMVDASARPGRGHLAIAGGLVAAGVSVLQLRAKDAEDAELLELARALAELPALLIVNDRVAVAAQIDGVGVHLGQDDLPVSEARRRLPGRVIGWSTHDLEQVQAAEADYIGFGPVFTAAGKHRSAADEREPMAARGVEGLAAAVAAASVPVVAIGGIGLGELASVVATGVHAVAAIGAVSGADDVEQAARAFQAAFGARA
jgi:thiamine-phosphate pyrophosphorylase